VKTTETGTAVSTTQPNSPVTYGKITGGDPNGNSSGGNQKRRLLGSSLLRGSRQHRRSAALPPRP